MARRRSRNRSKNDNYRRREIRGFSNGLPLHFDSIIRPTPYDPVFDLPRSSLRSIEDRRLWRPEKHYVPLQRVDRFGPRLVVGKSRPQRSSSRFSPGVRYPTPVVAFDAPEKTLVCVRREMRRQVLHAFKKTGKGSGGKAKFTPFSKISCRR